MMREGYADCEECGEDGEMCQSCKAEMASHLTEYENATPYERAVVLRQPIDRCPSCDGGVEGVDEMCFECAKAERFYEAADRAWDDFKDRASLRGEEGR